MELWILFAVLAALQVLDIVTTVRAFKNGAIETNKIMAYLMARIGVLPALAMSKAAVLGVVLAAVTYAPSMYLFIAMTIVVGFYVYIVINNARLG